MPVSTLRRKLPLRIALAVCAVIVMIPVTAGGAAAHGDPSLHALEGDVLYPAVADRPSPATELRLLTLLLAARDGGFPIKVALVANEADLTEDPTMLVKPEAYADALAHELTEASALPGPILVLTPYGSGLAGNTEGGARPLSPEEEAAMIAVLPALGASNGEALALEAEVAVRALAALAGHPLPTDVPAAAAMGELAASGTGAETPPAAPAGADAVDAVDDASGAVEDAVATDTTAPEADGLDPRVPLVTFVLVFLAALAGRWLFTRRRREQQPIDDAAVPSEEPARLG